jgi:D-isomer specific 2-hydroxyacid dehydrogenase-like protein
MPGQAVEEWRAILASEFPEADIAVWPGAPAVPEYALVWRPPAELFLRIRPSKAVFNLGAGVDATLDVFHAEPLPAEHAFWHHPRVTLTPHTSAVTRVADSLAQVAAKIRRLERGEAVTGIVDRVRGY